jgi:mRNA-degrading endonuclease RelE of RelBE toxin-antitoxin system
LKQWQIRFTPGSANYIRKLPPEPKGLVRKTIDDLKLDPYAGVELTGELEGFHSAKRKRYRIIYRLNEEKRWIEILLVGHRSDIYENLRQLLLSLRK